MPGKSKKGGGLETKKSSFYKMKGSPMQRNFGIGSPIKHKPWAEEHKEKVAHSGTKEAHVQSTPPKPKPNKDKNKVNDSQVYSTPE